MTTTPITAKHRAEQAVPKDDRDALMKIMLDHLTMRGSLGMTVAEAKQILQQHHHGTVSGILSTLHKHEEVALLNGTRAGCKIYVLPDHVENRPTVKQGREPRQIDVLLAYWLSPEPTSTTGRTTSTRSQKYPQRFEREIRECWERTQR